ncbi:MAG: diadenylate cyclase CdaA [Bacteroidaceae bacterium]|nr:diadenylate cyclase CdaA [Bacteroidaceae bacterium]
MIDFGIKDAIDIIAVAFLLYYFYKLMKDSGSLHTFYGILIFVVLWIIVSPILEMKLMGTIFDKLVSVGVLALIILFQEDIRRFFLTLGSNNQFGVFRKIFSKKKTKSEENPAIMQIVRACGFMSKNNIGALIIIEQNMSLSDIVHRGEVLDANINAQLIKNIFFKNSPLHDGAMVIRNNRISAAACILPVSHNTDISKDYGLRHRAALGITQQSDAVAIAVSEETGLITIAQRGKFVKQGANQEELESYLTSIMQTE